MQYRTLGASDLEVSVLAMGTWAMGGPWAHGWGPVDDGESIRSIQRALDVGINLIDTANVYGLGHAEEIIGQAVKGQRHKAIIATKVGAVVDVDGGITWDSTPEALFKEVENSLRRLDTDYIDLYQIHWPDAGCPLDETMGAFERLVEQGKIRYAGVCNFSLEQLQDCIPDGPVISHQIRYNILERDNEAGVIPFCIQNGIGILSYGPLAHGLLAGEFNAGDQLDPDDWRSRYTLFDQPVFDKVLAAVDRMKPMAEGEGRSLADLALNWTLGRPGVTSLLVGMRQARHVDQNLGALGWELSAEDLAEIDAIVEAADLGIRILDPDEYLEKVK